jgi:hypothetical protein
LSSKEIGSAGYTPKIYSALSAAFTSCSALARPGLRGYNNKQASIIAAKKYTWVVLMVIQPPLVLNWSPARAVTMSMKSIMEFSEKIKNKKWDEPNKSGRIF